MNKGYILLAIANDRLPDPSAYYKQAANLAISLKVHDPNNGKIGSELPICLLHCGKGHLPPNFWNLFDHHVQLTAGSDQIPFYSKTRLYDYSPFDETIYIDTDSLAIGDPDKLFNDLRASQFASCIVKQADYSTAGKIQMSWVTQIGELYEHYKIPYEWTFSELNSSLIYWKKSDLANDIFTLAEHFYACEFYPNFNGLAPKAVVDRGHFPDELAFECAMLHINYTPPPLDPFLMQFTNGRGGYVGWTTANKTFPLMTMPGGKGHSTSNLWSMYDKIRVQFARILGQMEGDVSKYGQGFRMKDDNKAANKANRKRWAGLRKRERPESIQTIIDKYVK